MKNSSTSASSPSGSSPSPTRRIASNLLWRPSGLVRNPILDLDPQGQIVALNICEHPDREHHTEFYSGVLVDSFPDDFRTAFTQMLTAPDLRLDHLLPTRAQGNALVVLSGLDYTTMSLTQHSAIQRII